MAYGLILLKILAKLGFSLERFTLVSLVFVFCTVYIKSFKGKNFHGFHGFLLTANVLLLKILLEYWSHSLTTQSMYHLVLSSQPRKFSLHIKL